MKRARRAVPILVSWIYNDADEQGCHGFQEIVLATAAEERQIRERLTKLTDEEVDPRTRSLAPLFDLYVGPIQTAPTPFAAFMKSLSANDYIATAEAALADLPDKED